MARKGQGGLRRGGKPWRSLVNSEWGKFTIQASWKIGVALALLLLLPRSLSAVAPGPLRVNPANPRYFTDGSGKAILLVGDHTWYTLQDGGPTDPPPTLDYNAYLNFLQSHNINFFRFFVWEQAKTSELVGTPWYYSPTIYQRPGPGNALDGKPKFDLNQFNQAYFDRLRQRVIDAGQRNLYVSIQLFEGFSVENKGYGTSPTSPWPGHPFNQQNNINGINGDSNGDGQGTELETLASPAVTALQDAYVRKVIDTVNDLDNVLFEICNESSGDTGQTQWQHHMIDLIHSYEAGKPKQHPVGFTAEWPGGNNAGLLNSNADWISPNSDGGYFDNPPANDGRKVIIADTDHLCYPCGDRQFVWRSFLRGNNPAFMDPYDCKGDPSPSGCNPNDPNWENLRQNLGYALRYANRMNLTAMTPHGELASSGYALANPSAEYLVYLPTGGTVTVNLTAASGTLAIEWFNPSNGATTNGGTTAGGTTQSFTAPLSGDAVLYLYSTITASTPTSTATATSATAPTPTPTPNGTIFMGETRLLGVDDSGNGNLLVAQQALLAQPATLQSLSFYVVAPSGRLQLAVYDSSGPNGGPGALKASTAEFAPVAGWNTQPVTAQILLPAGAYWLAYLPESSSLAFRYEQSGTARWSNYPYGPLPGQFSGTTQSGSFHWSFYATLLPSTAPTATPFNTPIPPTSTPTPSPTSVVNPPTATPQRTILLGETRVLNSSDNGNGNILVAQQATLAQAATIQSLSFYVTTASGRLQLAIYDSSDPNGGPGALKARTAEFMPIAGWNTQPVTAPVLLPAGAYWLAYLPESSNLTFPYEQAGVAQWSSYPYGPLPATFSSNPQRGAFHWSFYATLLGK